MVTTFYPPYNFGGDGHFVQQLSRDLVRAGHDVEVVHCTDAYRIKARRDPPPDDDRDDGVRVHRLTSPLGSLSPILTQQTGRPVLKGRALRRIFSRGFDVINYHNISLVGGPAVLGMGEGTKLYTLHEHWWVCPTHVLWRYTGELCVEPQCFRCSLAQRTPPQAWRAAQRWRARCLAEVDALLAPSRFTAARHAAWMKAAGVDVPLEVLPEYAPPFDDPANRPTDVPDRYFVYVGRLSREKGVGDLLAAFAQRPDYPLVVIGDGPMAEELRSSATSNVRWLGRVPRERLGAYYRAATALVFPSVGAETFGLTAVEALSCGTPVIATAAGGVEDVVTADVGFVFAGVDALVATLDRVWSRPEEARGLGAQGRARYLSTYTAAAYLERYFAAVARADRRRRCSTAAKTKTLAL
jgi:glycosyltransferase involved in cell wall biosynthesis